MHRRRIFKMVSCFFMVFLRLNALHLVLEKRLVGFDELVVLWSHHGSTVALVGVVDKVLLMIGLGRIELCGRCDLGHNRRLEVAARVQLGNELLGERLLLGLRVEHARSVLRADVVALSVELRRIVDEEEDLEKCLRVQHRLVVLDLNDLGVASIS